MEIYTLVLVTTMTTGLCYEPPRCVDQGGRRLCTSSHPTSCSPPAYYACKRPDRSEYTLSIAEAEGRLQK